MLTETDDKAPLSTSTEPSSASDAAAGHVAISVADVQRLVIPSKTGRQRRSKRQDTAAVEDKKNEDLVASAPAGETKAVPAPAVLPPPPPRVRPVTRSVSAAEQRRLETKRRSGRATHDDEAKQDREQEEEEDDGENDVQRDDTDDVVDIDFADLDLAWQAKLLMCCGVKSKIDELKAEKKSHDAQLKKYKSSIQKMMRRHTQSGQNTVVLDVDDTKFELKRQAGKPVPVDAEYVKMFLNREMGGMGHFPGRWPPRTQLDVERLVDRMFSKQHRDRKPDTWTVRILSGA